MFPADTPSHARATRSKRTRQTIGNEDSVKQPLTKKRRSALQPNTFEPLTEASINEVSGREKIETKVNGHAVEPPRLHTRSSSQSRELTLRGGKKADKRPERGGGQQVLSNNDFYTVAQLPSLPDKIRSSPSIPYACVISPENDYILALGHTEAFIWSYNTSSSTPSARDLITFKLPFPPASAGDPLPLATFTANAANGEPGIVALSPKWGRIVYWETITSASSSIPGQSSGVTGSVPGMLGGEAIEALVNAEPAGFIITFTHGRVAHLTIRDQMGRPGIGVQFLRKSLVGSARGGIFGSIKNVFIGDRRKGIPIVRAGKAAKGQRNILIGSEDGELEFWNTNLSVGNALTKTINVKEELFSVLKQKIDAGTSHSQVRVLDVDLVSTPASSHEIVKRADGESAPLILLIALEGQAPTRYYVVEAVVSGDEINIKELHRVRYPPGTDAARSVWRPRLSISKVQPVAFIVFESAIVIMSLARIRESPSSQLLTEKSEPQERFQDCVQFQEDSIYKVLGFVGEDLEKEASCVLAVQAFGLIRITSHLQSSDEIDLEDVESRIGPKTKIEQAIFFGTQRQNPLELSKPSEQDYSAADIETAVLQISNDILTSNSKFLPKSAPSTETQIKRRAKALNDLILHALKHYSSALSRSTRFMLLWNAEKLAAAQAIWKVQEGIQKTYPRNDDREFTYLQFVLRALHESRQNYPDKEKGETDHVRHWLINSVNNIGHLMSELESCLKELEPMDVRDPRIVCDYMTEALDIWIAAHDSAFRFREDNAQLYGLGDEVFRNGVLQDAHPAGLSSPWTSTPETFVFGQRLIYDICGFLDEWWEYKPIPNGNTKGKKSKQMPTDIEGKPYDAPSRKALLELASRLPAEVELFSRVTEEETLQAVANTKLSVQDPAEQAAKIADIRSEQRPRLVQAIRYISHFNMPGAIQLGEQLKDPGLLVELNKDFLKQLETQRFLDPESSDLVQRKIQEVQNHTETYYEKFGNGWAFAHFSDMIQSGEAGSMLTEAQQSGTEKQKYLTWFLKKSRSMGQRVGKVSWINEVLGEKRYERAQKSLELVASKEETDAWAQKTELCLAKLAGLAAIEAAHTSPQARKAAAVDQAQKHNDSLLLLDMQAALVTNVHACCSDAIDDKAARELALDTFTKRIVGKLPGLKRALTATIDLLLTNQSLSLPAIVDSLTLSDPVHFAGQPDEDPGILDHEFALALQAIDLAASSKISDPSLTEKDLDALRMVTWRRAMIRDDWLLLNNSTGKSDEEHANAMQSSSLFKTLLELFESRYHNNPPNSRPGSSSGTKKREIEPKLFSPTEILDATSLLTPALIEAYLTLTSIDPATSEAKRFLNELEKDLNKENDRLKSFVEKGQLQMHWEGMVREGERSVKAWLGIGIDAEAEVEAEADSEDNGHGLVPNGHDVVIESIEVAEAN